MPDAVQRFPECLLNPKLLFFVRPLVASGQYRGAFEVMRAALHLLRKIDSEDGADRLAQDAPRAALCSDGTLHLSVRHSCILSEGKPD